MGLGASALAADTATADLKLVPAGFLNTVGYYVPQVLHMTAQAPAGVIHAPAVSNPLYGQIEFGGKSYTVLLDEPDGGDAKLYVDSTGKGDFAHVAPADWTKQTNPGPDGQPTTMYTGSFKLPLMTASGPTMVQLIAYRYDKNDPNRQDVKDAILYFRDYGYDGKVTFNGMSYHAILANDAADGNFAPDPNPDRPPTVLLIDLNGNGKFDGDAKTFDASKPFNIHGTTWELSGMTSGGAFSILKSNVSVAEIPVPPNTNRGQPGIPFTAQTMDGKTVHFPQDFKGKLVLLDFWATWCGPCMAEMPNVVKAFGEYHSKGLEILGVSLDPPGSADNVKHVVSSQGMSWPVIYAGQVWDSPVATLYGIDAIPHPFLIDGTTGKIVAEGDDILGDGLEPAIEGGLKGLGGRPK
jgi:thiol-disulfide isomerase/thioredoxin